MACELIKASIIQVCFRVNSNTIACRAITFLIKQTRNILSTNWTLNECSFLENETQVIISGNSYASISQVKIKYKFSLAIQS